MPKFVAMLRVKDGMLFVHEWLACFENLVDEIVALDNGSSDGTYEVLKAHPKVVDLVRTEGYNEGRDKNLLYTLMRKRNPDWCIWVDIDEVFESELTRGHFDKLMNRSFVNKYAFRRFHFIDRQYFAGSWFRLSYSSGHDRMMWRESPTGYFQEMILDSPNVKGIKGIKVNTNFRLKHLGYISKDLVDKKASIYRSIEEVAVKESTLQEMYLRNERKIKWSDKRNSLSVGGLNVLLTAIQVTHMVPKMYKKLLGVFKNRQQKQEPGTAQAG